LQLTAFGARDRLHFDSFRRASAAAEARVVGRQCALLVVGAAHRYCTSHHDSRNYSIDSSPQYLLQSRIKAHHVTQLGEAGMSYVLIVQDSKDIADLAIRLLQQRGYTAYAVANSAEALDLLRESVHLPCLVLLDLCTPVMDGMAFRQQQTKEPRIANIPVIVFSSYSNVLRYGAQRIFDGYVCLPFEPDDLIQTITQYYPQA
jgi:CheY-like chemotaxis protein